MACLPLFPRAGLQSKNRLWVSIIVALLSVSACGFQNVSAPHQPEFDTICSVAVTIEGPAVPRVAEVLGQENMRFCNWTNVQDKEKQSFVATLSVSGGRCTYPKSGSDVTFIPHRFGSVAKYQKDCLSYGVDIVDWSQGVQRAPFAHTKTLCFISSVDDSPNGKLGFVTLGARLYQRHALPVMASKVFDGGVRFWVASGDQAGTDLSSAIIAAGQVEGYALEATDCSGPNQSDPVPSL